MRFQPANLILTGMDSIELIAVIEVPEAKKVLCQAEHCGHTVYRRVHIIKRDDTIGVYGSTCARKIFGHHIKNQTPTYSSGSGRVLTDEELALLQNNTAELLEQWRIEDEQSRIAKNKREALLRETARKTARSVRASVKATQPTKPIDPKETRDSLPVKKMVHKPATDESRRAHHINDLKRIIRTGNRKISQQAERELAHYLSLIKQ